MSHQISLPVGVGLGEELFELRVRGINPSAVKLIFVTLEQTLVLRRIGALDTRDQSALRKSNCGGAWIGAG